MENIAKDRRSCQKDRKEYKRNWDLKLRTIFNDPTEEAKRLERLEKSRKSKRDYSKNGPKYMQEDDKNKALEFIRQRNRERSKKYYYKKKNTLMAVQ